MADNGGVGSVIKLESVTKQFPTGERAVQDLSLEVAAGDVVVLVGPSGCGKTTTMRMINRLTEPTDGRILIDGEDIADADPVELRRGIGYVIQQIGLFPHQTIATNVGTVPGLLGWSGDAVAKRVDELLDLVGLEPGEYRDRFPHQLSGGQRQRVGVARALGADPPVLLMDEPFGAIDPITRERLQNEFLRLQDDLGKTVVFVTHDIEEAVKMGDRIALLQQGGVLAQYDEPAVLLGQPASDFVAEFVGADRGLKRLGVTELIADHVEHPPLIEADATVAAARAQMAEGGWEIAVVTGSSTPMSFLADDGIDTDDRVVDRMAPAPPAIRIGDSLKDALASMLLGDHGWAPVVGRDDAYVGVLTLSALHAATRSHGRAG